MGKTLLVAVVAGFAGGLVSLGLAYLIVLVALSEEAERVLQTKRAQKVADQRRGPMPLSRSDIDDRPYL